MRFVIQRVTRASVTIEERVAGQIRDGFLVLIGVEDSDTKEIADKIYRLSMDSTLKERLIIEEIKQLAEYDNNIQRLEKYMQIIESI